MCIECLGIDRVVELLREGCYEELELEDPLLSFVGICFAIGIVLALEYLDGELLVDELVC